MKAKAINKQVVINVLEQETKTAGGIILPDGSGGPVRKGVVLAIGPEAADSGLDVGDHVAYYKGHAMTIEGLDQYVVVNVDQLIYAVEPDGE